MRLLLSQLFFSAQAPSDVAERSTRGQRLSVDLLRWSFRKRRRLRFPFGFNLRLVFRCEDVWTAQILLGVHVLGMFCLAFLARVFLPRRVCHVLCPAIGRSKNCTGEEQRKGNAETVRMRQFPCGSNAPPNCLRDVECHSRHGYQSEGDTSCQAL